MITSRVIGEDFFFCKRLSTPQNHWYLCILWFPRVYNNWPVFTFSDLQHPYVSPACFPSCQQQFDYVFSNGTGARLNFFDIVFVNEVLNSFILSKISISPSLTMKIFNSSACRCWTAGWGKDEFSGSFQFIQHKVGSTYRICKEGWHTKFDKNS